MAYITKFSATKIARLLDKTIVDNVTNDYYKKPIAFLSVKDVKDMLAFKKLLGHSEDFIKDIYNKTIDTKTYVFESQPSFHSDSKCKYLHSDFENIYLPEKIKSQGDQKINQFRSWCREKKYLRDRDKEAFKAMCCLTFGLLPEELEDVKGKNSDIHQEQNYKLEDLEEKINKILFEADDYSNSSEKTQVILKKFKEYNYLRIDKYPFHNSTKYSTEEVRNILSHQYDNYISPTVALIKEWLRISLNPELKFEGRLLTQLGFKPCSFCNNETEKENEVLA
ncbi:MAG TPA: hypothetical protein VNX68_11615 [Nitrosopumilaceae archaeon]|jgi:hypothetical protein|nr:hypothetical protein [Nitrosopumilaceae archaeon]